MNRSGVAIGAFLAALLFSVAPGPAQTASPSLPPSPSASPVTLDVDGVPLTAGDFGTLMAGMILVYTPPKGAHPSSVFVTKKRSEMPAYDPDWHYASFENGPFDQPQLTIWIAEGFSKAPRELIERTAVLGLLDAGYGGPRLQQVYEKARTADVALGPNAADPWQNRRDLTLRLVAIIDVILWRGKGH